MRLFKRNKVDFFIVGAQKSGTSALDYYFRQHPDIEMPKSKKELHFFDKDELFQNKKINYKAFEKYFQFKDSNISGEATPIYMYWNYAIERIKNYNSKAKIIVILRNPVERAFSHYNMEVSKAKENLEFFDAVTNEENRISNINPDSLQHRVYSYKTRGLYYKQIQNIYNHFPAEQVCIIKYEIFLNNQKLILQKLFNFLNIDPKVADNLKRKEIYKIPYKNEIDNDAKNYLYRFFKSDVEQLENLLEWNCNDWKNE